jgi:hypothetical protein
MKALVKRFFYGSGKTYRVVPLPLLYIYPILVALDVLLTYLSTPDLKYEYNVIIKTLNLSWAEIIFGASITVMCVIMLIVKAETVFATDHQNNSRSNIHKVLFSLVVVFFYSHFLYSIFVIVNNYLSFIYLQGKDDFFLKELAVKYVYFYQPIMSWYCLSIYFILFFVGLIISTIRIYIIRK